MQATIGAKVCRRLDRIE